jgi:AraC family transcriptional activator of pobA
MIKQSLFAEVKQVVYQQHDIPPGQVLINRLEDLIDRHFRKQKDRAFYSSQLGYSWRSLDPICKHYTGLTIFRLIQLRCLLEAMLLLSRSCLSVKEISYDLGFEEPSYFARFFRVMTGKTPQEYRKEKAESKQVDYKTRY